MSKQKMRGVFAIVLSVVMLLGSVSMGVFAEDAADPAYTIVASDSADVEGGAMAALTKTVTLKAGEKLYIVYDAYKADGTLNANDGVWTNFYNFENQVEGVQASVSVKLGDEQKAIFTNDCFGVNQPSAEQGTAGAGFTYNYSYTAKADMTVDEESGKVTDAANHLLDNLTAMTTFAADGVGGMGAGWTPGNSELDLGMTALFSQSGWVAMTAGAGETYVGRPVLAFEAAEAGDYTVTYVRDSDPANMMYLLQDKAEEAPVDPAPGGDGEGNGDDACTHEKATEVENTAKAATCTEAGQKADKVCPDCEETIKGEAIPVLGHDFGENQPKCSRCGERNPDYVYVPSGPYYEVALQTTADEHAEGCPGSLFENNQYVTLKQGQKMYIVLDPVDAEGNLATGDDGTLECQSLTVESVAGAQYATFGKYMDISGQGENGFTYGYSYTLLENWTAETAKDLLLDNFAEMKWKASPKDDGTCQLSGTTDWWAVESTDELTFPQYLSIIGNHFGSLVSQTNDTMIARPVLVFEAPSDGRFKVVSQYREWNAAVESQVYVLVEAERPAGTTPGGNAPATGVDTFVWPVALVALVTMATGVVLCTKKSRAK